MTASDRSIELATAAGRAAADKLATTILALDVSEHLAITDVFVIVSGDSERQLGALVDEIEDVLRELGAKPIRREGQREGRWVLIDFGDTARSWTWAFRAPSRAIGDGRAAAGPPPAWGDHP